jgi:hypothetical protein
MVFGRSPSPTAHVRVELIPEDAIYPKQRCIVMTCEILHCCDLWDLLLRASWVLQFRHRFDPSLYSCQLSQIAALHDVYVYTFYFYFFCHFASKHPGTKYIFNVQPSHVHYNKLTSPCSFSLSGYTEAVFSLQLFSSNSKLFRHMKYLDTSMEH